MTRSPRTDGGPPAGERRLAPWRRALALAVAAWTVVALALPGEALASPGATHVPAHAAHPAADALATHPAWASAHERHARGGDAVHASAAVTAHHGRLAHPAHPAMAGHAAGMAAEHCGDGAPSPHHSHHGDCRDCCCAAPISGLPAAAAAFAPPVISHLPAAEPRPEETPRAVGDHLHPFPNGPPLHRA